MDEFDKFFEGDEAPALPVRSPQPADGSYRAFGRDSEDSTMLDVRLVPEVGMQSKGEILPLHLLLRVTYTTTAQRDLLSLAFSECIVMVSGRNLAALRLAIMAGQVDFLQAFDSGRWKTQPPAGEPVITSLQVRDRVPPDE